MDMPPMMMNWKLLFFEIGLLVIIFRKLQAMNQADYFDSERKYENRVSDYDDEDYAGDCSSESEDD